jgi:hypothetical protein
MTKRTDEEIKQKITELEYQRDHQKRYSSFTSTIYNRMIESIQWATGRVDEL